MPLPLIAWAIGALVAGALAGKGGEKYGEHQIDKAKALIGSAEAYARAKQGEFTRKRRSYLERMQSYVQMIHLALGETSTTNRDIQSELPSSLKDAWTMMLVELRSLAPNAADSTGIALTHRKEIEGGLRSLAAYSRVDQSLGPLAAIATSAYYAYDGVAKAVNGAKAYEKADAASSQIRAAADRQLASIDRLYDDLGMRWDSVVMPFVGRAKTDEALATVLLEMAADLSTELARLLREFGDE